jgi:hypothetical protein
MRMLRSGVTRHTVPRIPHAFITLYNKYTYKIILCGYYACGPIPRTWANPHATKNALRVILRFSDFIVTLHKQTGSSDPEMHVSKKNYNVNDDWRHVSLSRASLNRGNRVYRADQYIYKFQQSTAWRTPIFPFRWPIRGFAAYLRIRGPSPQRQKKILKLYHKIRFSSLVLQRSCTVELMGLFFISVSI